jgi:ribosomal protein S12 methylthiotransferase
LKIGFVSLGCPKNLVDSEVMMGQLAARGHELTPHPSDADVIVVNTCSFIDPAKQESIDTILEMAEYKKTGRAQRLIVAGCLVERYRGDIRKNMPEVDAVIGTNELERITALCEGIDRARPILSSRTCITTSRRAFSPRRGISPTSRSPKGCDHPCTFCVIPQYRGAFRSRRFESVISEATRLFSQGVREINLIGQDTTCYGEDSRAEGRTGPRCSRVWRRSKRRTKSGSASCTPIRTRSRRSCSTRSPSTGAGQIHRHAAAARERPGPEAHEARGFSGDIFLKLIERIRRPSRRGHPHQHDRRVSWRDRRRISRRCASSSGRAVRPPGCFSYSDEDTSGSFPLDGKVDGRTIYNRKRRLMAICSARFRAERNRSLVGREFPVLLDGPSSDSELVWQARLPTQAPEIDGVCYISDAGEHPLRAGDMRTIRITAAHDHDLTGDLTDDVTPAALKGAARAAFVQIEPSLTTPVS